MQKAVQRDEKEIVVEVLVPVSVPEGKRNQFEEALMAFLFGHERLRPELEKVLRAAGVDTQRLATLSKHEKLGVCRDVDALEFVPSKPIVSYAKDRGIDFTHPGNLSMLFNYGHHRSAPTDGNTLRLNLYLPEAFTQGQAISDDLLGEITDAIFGSCRLSGRAQAYLRVFGIDVEEFAAEHKSLLGGGTVPPTSRVEPAVARVLDEFGFRTNVYGQLQVNQVQKRPS